MSTPDLQLRALFKLDARNAITSTLEPGASRGPIFSLIRGPRSCAWAVRAGLPARLAGELSRLAELEPPTSDFREPPSHADEYLSLIADGAALKFDAGNKAASSDGPAFTFSELPSQLTDVVRIDDERGLVQHFSGWLPNEIAEGRGPVMAVVVDGHPVSICYCARSSPVAAEAGVETASAYRGRGFAPRVVAAWAVAIRAAGRIPLYSTSWQNRASLSVARKLALSAYASNWSVPD